MPTPASSVAQLRALMAMSLAIAPALAALWREPLRALATPWPRPGPRMAAWIPCTVPHRTHPRHPRPSSPSPLSPVTSARADSPHLCLSASQLLMPPTSTPTPTQARLLLLQQPIPTPLPVRQSRTLLQSQSTLESRLRAPHWTTILHLPQPTPAVLPPLLFLRPLHRLHLL